MEGRSAENPELLPLRSAAAFADAGLQRKFLHFGLLGTCRFYRVLFYDVGFYNTGVVFRFAKVLSFRSLGIVLGIFCGAF